MPDQAERAHSAERHRDQLRERLLDLAYDASSYLRRHRDGVVRTSAALLLAASLAACSSPSQSAVTPLSAEVRSGLPTIPGGYSIDPSTLGRDPQGVYHFSWRPVAGGAWTPASASLLRLAEGGSNALEVPAGGDPILYLSPDTPIPLIESAAVAQTPTSSGSRSSGYSWYPFYGGTGSTGPAYRNPSTTVSGGSTVQGSTSSTIAPPPAARTSGLAHAVSGQAGGTGSGTAASSKSGIFGSGFGAATAKSGGFSSGSGGGFSGGSVG